LIGHLARLCGAYPLPPFYPLNAIAAGQLNKLNQPNKPNKLYWEPLILLNILDAYHKENLPKYLLKNKILLCFIHIQRDGFGSMPSFFTKRVVFSQYLAAFVLVGKGYGVVALEI